MAINTREKFLFNVDKQLNIMPHLILLRHGESADKQHGQSDFERVLTTRGMASISRLAKHLLTEKIIPDYALVSPAQRTKQTAALLLDALALKLDWHQESDLYYGGDLAYQNLIASVVREWSCILLVGHNPSISALVGRLTKKTHIGLHPGEAAILSIDNGLERAALLKTLGPFL